MGIAGGIFEPTGVGAVALVTGAASGAYLTARTVWSARAKRLWQRLGGLMSGLSQSLDSARRRIGDQSAADDPETPPGA